MQKMPHLLVLRVHVQYILLIACHLYGITVHHLNAEMVQTEDLHRVVGHQYKFPYTQIGENSSSDIIVTKVGLEAKGADKARLRVRPSRCA